MITNCQKYRLCNYFAGFRMAVGRAVVMGGIGWGGGGVVNSPTFLKLTYSEVWVGHSENKGDNRLDSTNVILLNCIVSTKFKKL